MGNLGWADIAFRGRIRGCGSANFQEPPTLLLPHRLGLSPLSPASGSGIVIHTADLSPERRELVERYFRQGAVRLLVATSTLTLGLNLPARNVLVDERVWREEPRPPDWHPHDLTRAKFETPPCNEPITPLWCFFMSAIWPVIACLGPIVVSFWRQIEGVVHPAAGEAECLGDSLVGDTQGPRDRSDMPSR